MKARAQQISKEASSAMANSACLRSGSRTPPPGWHGRIIAPIGRENLSPIPWVYAEIIRCLAAHERVELIVNDAAAEKRARKILDRANALNDNVRFHRWPTNRVWTRDSGCTFVVCRAPLGRTAVGGCPYVAIGRQMAI